MNNLIRFLLYTMLLAAVLAAQAKEPITTPVVPQGMVIKSSQFSVSKTLDRLEKIITEKGITVFIRVDHSSGGQSVNLPLRPTQVLIFGNPKLGTLLMQSSQTAGIDLPLKAIAWEDDKGQVWLGYNTPEYIATRHGITDQGKTVEKIKGALNKFSDFATGR